MKLLVLCVVTVLFSVISAAIPFKECDSKTHVKGVGVLGCTVAPCTLKRGTNATIEVDFVADTAAKQLKAVVHGIIGGVPIPFNPPNVNGCVDSGITCPVVAGKSYKYTNKIPVLKDYPKIRLVVKYELVNENSQSMFCVELPAQIQ
ncbi:NPC intracellular cholesterol transporter 2-like [Saccostrea echinata]|uniref:NPC intracellular cholesterol transporter 2-like n=1 Tax=Saccostrea echinata TaxID=191078 RepID=UPI002A80E141|nr:NPC intracellular cholesterol transporter 2-like [Saccostrea echinata]